MFMFHIYIYILIFDWAIFIQLRNKSKSKLMNKGLMFHQNLIWQFITQYLDILKPEDDTTIGQIKQKHLK
jgi:hypothetical protein